MEPKPKEPMNLSSIMRKYSDEIGGQYTEYDPTHSIVIITVPGGRYQTVIGTIRQNELFNRKLIAFNSKVCPVPSDFDYRTLLEQTAFFNYCRFVIREDYLEVEAVTSLDNISEESVKEMIQEVANLADQYEMKLTGADVN